MAKNLIRIIFKPIELVLRGLIVAYRYLFSSLTGPCCRFVPSCSEYATTALKIHGPFKGSWLTLKRIARCSPFTKLKTDEKSDKGCGIYDPVP